MDLYPLKNLKNLKTSGLVPTRNNKKSLIEWGHTPTSMPTAGNPPSRSAVVYLSNISAELLRLSLSGGADRPLSFHYPLHLPLIGGGLPPSAPARSQRRAPPRRATIIVRGRPNILDFFRIGVYHRYMIRHRTERPLRSGLRPETISALILLTQQF